jgi:hypothetical protein
MVPAFQPPRALNSIDSKTYLTRYQLADSLEGCGIIPISYEMLNTKAKNGDPIEAGPITPTLRATYGNIGIGMRSPRLR